MMDIIMLLVLAGWYRASHSIGILVPKTGREE